MSDSDFKKTLGNKFIKILNARKNIWLKDYLNGEEGEKIRQIYISKLKSRS